MSDSVEPEPNVIGQVSDPPFAVLPDPETLFAERARRLRVYADVSPLKPYLDFVAGIADAQGAVLSALPPVQAPPEAARAAEHAMPPLDRAGLTLDAPLSATLDALFDRAKTLPMPDEARKGLEEAMAADAETHLAMVRGVLARAIPPEALAAHIFVAAALQVHFARLAQTLEVKKLVKVGDGLCPACGDGALASLVVDWPNAHGSRFCSCGTCGTLWHYTRIHCCSCGDNSGIGYQEVDGSPGTIKAETCDKCQRYTKVMYQNKDGTIEPFADDIGTLALDLMMREGPYARAPFNPFLLGF